MNHLLPIVHALGTKPLTVSLAAQAVVIALAVRAKDKEQLTQSVILMVGLVLAVVSIALRPPSAMLLVPDSLGTAASVFFIAPAVQSLMKLRGPQKSKKSG